MLAEEKNDVWRLGGAAGSTGTVLVEGTGVIVMSLSGSGSSLVGRDRAPDAVSGSKLACRTLPLPIISVVGEVGATECLLAILVLLA